MAALGIGGIFSKVSAAMPLPDRLDCGKRRSHGKTGRYDEDLVVIISDLHITPKGYQPEKFIRTCDDILKMQPLPFNVIALGDLAYHTGRSEDYALLRELLAPLEKAGIQITLGMGNHDRREEFAAAFPEKAAASLLGDRYVFKVETPRADLIVLDSLQQSEDPDNWVGPGALGDGQIQWLERTLASYTKPVFVCAHHPLNEVGIEKMLSGSPTCSGYIYGHKHRWVTEWIKNRSHRDLVRTLCVPSTGYYGDIGHVVLRMDDKMAEASLHQYEFFFPTPLESGEAHPALWDIIESEHKGATCGFVYR